MPMKIVAHQNIKVGDIVAGYLNDPNTGEVTAYGGRLNVRPAYQREFVWDNGGTGGKKQQALIDSIMNHYPINVMYWVKTGQNQAGEDMFECLDGQQRIITMCEFHENSFGMDDGTQFSGLTDTSKFLDYDMFTVYICEADSLEEKLAWFERINTAGEPLAEQEMRSAIACGAGTTQAKKHFVNTRVKNGTNAWSFDIQSGRSASDYVSGAWDRQAIYEKVITWFIGSKKDEDILAYMKNHRDDVQAADDLFEYFKNVIRWVKRLFPTYNKDMAKVEWGLLYNAYHSNNTLSATVLERDVKYLRSDVGRGENCHLDNTKGIYEYVLARACGNDDPSLLSRRAFTPRDKEAQYERQRHVCPHCMKRFESIKMMDGDHIVPYHPIPSAGQLNGPTVPSNLQMLCHSCNLDKANKPFDKAAEEQRLQTLYALTDDEIAALPEAEMN